MKGRDKSVCKCFYLASVLPNKAPGVLFSFVANSSSKVAPRKKGKVADNSMENMDISPNSEKHLDSNFARLCLGPPSINLCDLIVCFNCR